MSKHTETPIDRELVERLTEIAYRDTAQSVTVRAADLRAAVRAVNAHEGLVAALTSLLVACDKDSWRTDTTRMDACMEAARAALSAAKE